MGINRRNDLDIELRKYKLDNLLLLIANKTRKMYLAKKSLDTVIWNRNIGGFRQTFQQYMPIWGLAELSYRAIKNSNDFRSKEPGVNDLARLNNLLIKTADEDAGYQRMSHDTEQAEATIFLGLSQTQLWGQQLAQNRAGIVYHFLRYFLLLKVIPETISGCNRPDDDLKKITGFGIEDFSRLLYVCYVWILSTPTSEISRLGSVDGVITEKYPVVTSDNIKKCSEYFTGNYKYYRDCAHLNNPLFFRPIVQTDTKRLIVSNTFLFAKKFYEGIYWLIREKNRIINSQDFTNAFGRYYEKYIELLFKYYLKPDVYDRVGEDKGGADWIIDTGKYCLIVEQKSSLMSIKLKTEYPPIEEFREYLKSFNKACYQLRKTEKDLKQNSKPVIKLILHFEKLYFKESFIKPQLLKLRGNDSDNLKRYYLIDTEEFELFIQLLMTDIDAANDIIDTKISYEDNPPPPIHGLDFYDIFVQKKKYGAIKFLEDYRYIFDGLISIKQEPSSSPKLSK